MSEDMRQEMNGMKTRLAGVETRLGGVEVRLGGVEKAVRNIAVVVAGHTETLVRLEQKLTKLDELDGLKTCLEVFTTEIIASRHERALAGKTFNDQQAMLTNHELRLTRIELHNKLT